MAVVRNEVTIQNGHDLCEFLASKFSNPVGDNVELKHGRFFMLIKVKLSEKEENLQMLKRIEKFIASKQIRRALLYWLIVDRAIVRIASMVSKKTA